MCGFVCRHLLHQPVTVCLSGVVTQHMSNTAFYATTEDISNARVLLFSVNRGEPHVPVLVNTHEFCFSKT